MSQILGYVPFSQTKIDLFDELNFELSSEEMKEAIGLSGYSKKDKVEITKEIDSKKLTNTGRMWYCALMGVWKTMMDVDGWKLPATLNSYNICGKGFFKICPFDNFVKKFVYGCNRLGCEVCAKRAGARIARRIERRIWLYCLKIKHDTKGRRTPLPSHVIEAIEPDSPFWKLNKDQQARVLKKARVLAGIIGGVDITHLWRFNKLDLTPIYSPHKHLIAIGWIKSDAYVKIEKELKIKINYIKVRNGTLRSRLDVFSVAYYQLSHASVKGNKHSLKWFGALSYRNESNKTLAEYRDEEYKKQDVKIEKTKHCPFCDEKLIPAKINVYFENWRNWIPPPEELEEGCKFAEGLFLSIDFKNKNRKEKMPYYDGNYNLFYKKTLEEKKIIRDISRPDLYCRKTKSQKLMVFM